MMAEVPPATPREKRITLIALVIAIGFGVALFGGFIPGLKPNATAPATVLVDGHSYYWMDYYYPGPVWPLNYTTPSAVAFHNITFDIWVSSWYQLLTGYVHGNASEPNGTSFSFVLGGPANLPGRETLYLSPDEELGAAWNGQAFVVLLVLAPGSG